MIYKVCLFAFELFFSEYRAEPCSTLPPPCMNESQLTWVLVEKPQGADEMPQADTMEYQFKELGQYVFELQARVTNEGQEYTTTMMVDTFLVGKPADIYPDEYNICLGDTVHMLPNTTPAEEYEWIPVPDDRTPMMMWTVNEYCRAKEYFVINVEDCSPEVVSEEEKHMYMYVPDAFSPNGDEVNDKYSLFTNAAIDSFSVHDRWGNLITEEYPWDGNGKDGKQCKPGVYLMKARYSIGRKVDFVVKPITLVR